MKQFVRNVKIIGTGSYVPYRVFTNKELELICDTKDEWVRENVGINERRISDVSTSELASRAGKEAILNAGLLQKDIDLIIVATATPDYLAPSTACLVQNNLHAVNAVAFDISAVCSGFMYGMSVASQYIASGVYDNVLVVGADTFSYHTDWSDRSCVFFGDGAGAAVLSHAKEDEGFLAFRLYSDGSGWNGFTMPLEGTFRMNGKAVYDTATKVLPKAINQVLEDTGLSVDDINLMIPHQPSIRILKETARQIGLPFDKVMTNMDKYANTSAGTIPILLDETYKAGKIEKGDIILFAAVGSGWTYGASIIKWA